MKQVTLEQEFNTLIAYRVYSAALHKMVEYNKIVQPIDIPEFMKPKEEQLTTIVDKYVTKLIEKGELYKAYNTLCI